MRMQICIFDTYVLDHSACAVYFNEKTVECSYNCELNQTHINKDNSNLVKIIFAKGAPYYITNIKETYNKSISHCQSQIISCQNSFITSLQVVEDFLPTRN